MIIPLLFILILLLNAITRNKHIYYFSLFSLTLLVALRDETIGTDTEQYILMYEHFENASYNGWPEPLYAYSMIFFNRIGANFHVFQWFIALLTTLFFHLGIKKCSKNPFYSLFCLYSLFFIFYLMNINRQIIAVSIVFYALTFLYEKRKIPFAIFVLIAATFHYASLITFGMLLALKIKGRRNLYTIGILFSLILGFIINEAILGSLLGPYSYYLNSTEHGFRTGARTLQALMLCTYFSGMAFLIITTIKKIFIDNFWLKVFVCGIILNNLTMKLDMGLRIVMFYTIAQIIIYNLYIHNHNIKQKYFIFCTVNTFMLIYFFFLFFTGSAGIFPYKTFLF